MEETAENIGRKLTSEEIKNTHFVKVMFNQKSSLRNEYEYKIDELNIADNWNPSSTDPKIMGGYNMSTINSIIRWLNKGDTLYDVIIPKDAEIYDCWYPTTLGVVFRTNKFILTNPRTLDDNMAMEIYLASDLKELLYPKAMIGCIKRGYMYTALRILQDKINVSNIDFTLEEFKDSFKNKKDNVFDKNKLDNNAKKIYDILVKIKEQ